AERVLPRLSRSVRPRPPGRRRRAARLAASAGRPTARSRPRLVRLLRRVLPARPLAHRSSRYPALHRAVPERDARLGAGHRPRFPARDPRGADPAGVQAVRPRARRARLLVSHLPPTLDGARDRQGAGSAAGRDRASRETGGPTVRRTDELDQLPGFAGRRSAPLWKELCELAEEIAGLPRHISQHVGGMVISSRPLVEIVPLERAAMEDRVVCQWDKDSCDDARFIKIDFLALGMLSL